MGLEFDEIDVQLPTALYGRAGHFVSFLLDIYGPEPTVELLEAARPGDPPEILKADITAAFGLPYENILNEYANYPVCSHDQFRWPIAECADGGQVDAIDDAWSIDVSIDCARNDVLGTRVGEDWTVRTITVVPPGTYLITVSGEAGDLGFIELGHCSPGCASDKGIKIDVGDSQEVVLRPGRYHVTSVGLQVKSGRHRTRIEPKFP
jgi:hypothetical protein